MDITSNSESNAHHANILHTLNKTPQNAASSSAASPPTCLHHGPRQEGTALRRQREGFAGPLAIKGLPTATACLEVSPSCCGGGSGGAVAATAAGGAHSQQPGSPACSSSTRLQPRSHASHGGREVLLLLCFTLSARDEQEKLGNEQPHLKHRSRTFSVSSVLVIGH